jgi:hypothetical protein
MGVSIMPKDPKATEENDQDVSRRGLLEKAALIVGVATSVDATRVALARSADVVMDSAGRVLIDGATVSTQSPGGSFEEAKNVGGGGAPKTGFTSHPTPPPTPINYSCFKPSDKGNVVKPRGDKAPPVRRSGEKL